MNERLENDLKQAYAAFRDNHDVLREDLLKALPEQQPERQSGHRHSPAHRLQRGPIMNNRLTKLAVAAAIVIAVPLGLHFLGGSADGTSVVLAQAVRKMETINDFTCRMTSWRAPAEAGADSQAREEMTMKLWYSNEYGFKMEQYAGGELILVECLLRQTSEGMRIWPQKKAYVRMPLSDEQLSQGPAQKMDPRDWVRRFAEADFTPLGKRTTDGVEIEGVETNDLGVIRSASSSCEDYAARLWVDLQTQLPVAIEEEYTMGSVRTGGGADEFAWNPGLTTADFEPEIPADYINRAEQPTGAM